jgi:hypothetical protein
MTMHKLSIPAEIVARVTERVGRPHPFDQLDPAKTALMAIDPPSTASRRSCGSSAAMWCG